MISQYVLSLLIGAASPQPGLDGTRALTADAITQPNGAAPVRLADESPKEEKHMRATRRHRRKTHQTG